MKTRIERDTMGEISVPATAYWGAQTQRSLENFQIGKDLMPPEVIRAFALVKKAAARVNREFKLVSRDAGDLIEQACDEILAGKLDGHFPLAVWQTGSGTQTNMNVNEVISNRAHVLAGNLLGQGDRLIHPNNDVNRSQSSNDTFPTAMHIAAVTVLNHRTLKALAALENGLAKKAAAWGHIVKTGRTHFMDAVPLTLGQAFSGYAAMVARGIRSLQNSLPGLHELALGGTAVGTGLNAPGGFDEKTVALVARWTGFDFVPARNKFEALAAHGAIVDAHAALKAVAVGLMKIANDIRMLGSGPRCGIGELQLPANEPGSSIMPGKVNPTQVEALTMVCTQVMGNDTAVTVAGASGQFELNVYKPVIIKNFLESARLLADAAQSFLDHCVAGIVPDEQKIAAHLENSLMLVTALTPHIGYEPAARIAKMAQDQGLTLKQAALDLKLMTAEEFDEYLDPARMTGPLDPGGNQ